MPTINGRACVVNGVPVDKVFSDGRQVYGRNLLADSGFESGNVPANYAWGVSDNRIRTVKVISATDTCPTPFGNYMLKIDIFSNDAATTLDQYAFYPITPVLIKNGETWTYSYYYASAGTATGQASDYLLTADTSPLFALSMAHSSRETSGGQTTWHRFVKTWTADRDVTVAALRFGFIRKSTNGAGWICIDNIKLEQNPTVSPWTPAPEDVM
ncbi:phage tail fiber protein [Lacticaseibacillus casei A2-362]|nr:phage tail fiber protein [Lacticaseibacillus casei A2-362]